MFNLGFRTKCPACMLTWRLTHPQVWVFCHHHWKQIVIHGYYFLKMLCSIWSLCAWHFHFNKIFIKDSCSESIFFCYAMPFLDKEKFCENWIWKYECWYYFNPMWNLVLQSPFCFTYQHNSLCIFEVTIQSSYLSKTFFKQSWINWENHCLSNSNSSRIWSKCVLLWELEFYYILTTYFIWVQTTFPVVYTTYFLIYRVM